MDELGTALHLTTGQESVVLLDAAADERARLKHNCAKVAFIISAGKGVGHVRLLPRDLVTDGREMSAQRVGLTCLELVRLLDVVGGTQAAHTRADDNHVNACFPGVLDQHLWLGVAHGLVLVKKRCGEPQNAARCEDALCKTRTPHGDCN